MTNNICVSRALVKVGIAGSLVWMASVATAQNVAKKDTTLNRTVVVEQEYNPDINDAIKINILPAIEEPTVTKKQIQYDKSAVSNPAIPKPSMGIYVGKEEKEKPSQGYARLGLGNHNKVDAQVNYLFYLSPKDRLTVHGGMDGFKETLTRPANLYRGEDGDWKARYYRAGGGFDYLHQFNKVDFDLSGRLQQANFNYQYPLMNNLSTDKQKHTAGELHIGVKSTDETWPFSFAAETNLLTFGKKYSVNGEAVKETIARTKAMVKGQIDDLQSISIAMQMDNFFYNSQAEDYTSLQMNPFYEYANDSWKLRVGANVDLSFGFDKGVRMSPDLEANYLITDSYILYAQAKGGKTLNDFRTTEKIHLYSTPENVARVFDSYNLLNAKVGFKASPTEGLWFNLFGGYNIVANDISPICQPDSTITFAQGETKAMTVGAALTYDYKDIFSFSTLAEFYKWSDSSKEFINQKPKFQFSADGSVKVTKKLSLNAGYHYMHRATASINSLEYSMPNISNLHAGVAYNLYKGISLYAQFDNILNSDNQYYCCYPAETFSFIGGFNFKF